MPFVLLVGMAVFLDKLSERLAFERTGVRLYEALLDKCQTLGEAAPGPTLEEIEHIGGEELADRSAKLADTVFAWLRTSATTT